MKTEMRKELTEHIIPFWHNMRDDKFGGFYGEKDFDLKLYPLASKACLINSRILWFFSSAYLELKDEQLLDDAKHAFEFMKAYCIDSQNGGIFWSLNHDGSTLDTTKHTYNQAFGIYALTAYYNASKDKEALNLAYNIYNIIENKCKDIGGYLECFEIDFTPQINDKLSGNGVQADRTMNTLLHVMEAYTTFAQATNDDGVKANLEYIINIFMDKMYNPDKHRNEVFFDENYNSLIDMHSYGHDIEACWLIDKACQVLGNEEITNKIEHIIADLADSVYNKAFTGNSVLNECVNGTDETTRIWWVQAESIVGYINAYQKDTSDNKYLETAKHIWSYVKDNVVDKREGSEWFENLNDEAKPKNNEKIAAAWKGPYHNGRMCLEILRRM